MSFRCLFAVLAVAAVLPAQPPCSIQTVVGTWAVQGQGTVFPTPPGATTPIAVPGTDLGLAYIGYDGSISIKLVAITTRSGGPGPQTLTGAMVVNPDCTATVTAPTPIPGFTFKEHFAILDHGNEIWTIAVNGIQGKPAVWQCHWKRISTWPWSAADNSLSNCSAGLLRGSWAGTYNGVMVPADASAPAPTGIVMTGGVNREGELEGTFTSSLGGTVRAGTYSGSMTALNPDCTGTWTWTLTGADGGKLPGAGVEKFVVLNGGKEIWTMSAEGTAGTPVGAGRWQQLSPAPYR